MARVKKKGSKSKAQFDWVVNELTYGRSSLQTVPDGVVAAFPLTIPAMQLTEDLFGFGGLAVGGQAFPQRQDRQFVKAVSGYINWEPSSWVAGTRFETIIRIVKKPMDANTGDAIADALYSLYEATYANERFAWQHRAFEPFNTGSNFQNIVRVKATINQYLEPDEALYVIVESQALGIPNVNWTFFLRTLLRV